MNCPLISKQLRRGGGGGNIPPKFDAEHPPSISLQSEWPCYAFDFSKSEAPPRPGTDYLNCGLVARPDGDWLLVRRSVWKPNFAFGINDVLAFKLDCVTPTVATAVDYSRGFPDEHFEDPRALYWGGRTWVSGTNFIWYPKFSGCHQILVESGPDWKCLKRHDPDYGGNGKRLYDTNRNEKNWIWFFHDNKPHLIYMTTPHEVVRFSDDFMKVEEVYKTEAPGLRWAHGEPRGGTPPVLVNGEYWSFFHSSVDWCPHGTRRYFMGAYSFTPEPPFKVLRFTPKAILMGSDFDRCAKDKPLVVFPCGAIIRNGRWLVSLGVNDLDCAFIRIPHSELMAATRPIIRPQVGALQPA